MAIRKNTLEADLSKLEEKNSKKIIKTFNGLQKESNLTQKTKVYEYKLKSKENIDCLTNVLSYPTELLLGLKELKNNSIDISNMYITENESKENKNGEIKKVKAFFAEGYINRINKDNLGITTLTAKTTPKVEKAVEKQISNVYLNAEKASKKGRDLTNYTIIKEPIDTSLTHSNDVLSYPLVPLLTLNDLYKKGVYISESYTTNIDGQDYLIINANLESLIPNNK